LIGAGGATPILPAGLADTVAARGVAEEEAIIDEDDDDDDDLSRLSISFSMVNR
jgi:hypothetical protein